MTEATSKEFEYVLKLVTPARRDMAEAVFAALPDSLLTAPSSMTGKYHPPDEIDKGGLSRHVHRFVSMVDQGSRLVSDNAPWRDALYIAAVAHDAYKEELVRDLYWSHPLESARNVWTITNYAEAAEACLYHEGRWTDPRCITEAVRLGIPTTQTPGLREVMHFIDYFISRREGWNIMQSTYREVKSA
jgi:hypothetical protein